MARSIVRFKIPKPKEVYGKHPEIFGPITDPRQRLALKRTMFDGSMDNRTFARRLKVIGGAQCIAALFRCSKSKKGDLRANAVWLLSKLKPKGFERVMVKASRLEPNYNTRFSAILSLFEIKGKAAENVLKGALFDTDREIRSFVSNHLSKRIGLAKVFELINSQFPQHGRGERASMDFFYFKNDGSKRSRQELKDVSRKGRFGFYHQGLPVRLVPSRLLPPAVGASLPALGKYHQGVLWLNADTKILPKRFRRAMAEHEFGEAFSHNFGQAMMLSWLASHAQLPAFWKHFKGKPFAFIRNRELPKLVEEFPREFGKLASVLK